MTANDLESTRLLGASDFLIVRAMHQLMLSNPEAIEATVRYLETGHFRKNGKAQPILFDGKEERTADLPAK